MKKTTLFILLFIVLLGLAPAVKADGITYSLADLGGGNWSYTYTITNTDEPSGLYVFDIYFPSVSSLGNNNYSNITATANPDATNWITTVFPPSEPDLGGVYDAEASIPIAPGDSLGGFGVSFSYSGTAPLGAQEFEIYDPNFNLLETGTTTLSTTPTPEPSTLIFLVSGLLGFLGLGRWPRK